MGTLDSVPPASKPFIASSQNGANYLLTIAMGAVTAIPAVQTFIAAHPVGAANAVSGIFAVLNVLWRTFITKQPVQGFLTSPN